LYRTNLPNTVNRPCSKILNSNIYNNYLIIGGNIIVKWYPSLLNGKLK